MLDFTVFDQKTAMITGRRPAALGHCYGWYHPTRVRIRQVLEETLWGLYESGYRTFMSGMAQGADQDFFAVARSIKADPATFNVKLVAAVPFIGQDTLWPVGDRTRYVQMLRDSDLNFVVGGTGYASYKLHQRNIWMVDQLQPGRDVVLALWDGIPNGGTWRAMEYAREKGLEPVVIDTNQFFREVPIGG
jgi:uncharacterized phage-like protein YoqJ